MKIKKYLMLLFAIPFLSLTSCRDFNKGDCTEFEFIIEKQVMKIDETQKVYLSTTCKISDGSLFVFTIADEKILIFDEQTLTITAIAVGKSDFTVRFTEYPDVVQTKSITVIKS